MSQTYLNLSRSKYVPPLRLTLFLSLRFPAQWCSKRNAGSGHKGDPLSFFNRQPTLLKEKNKSVIILKNKLGDILYIIPIHV